MSTVEYIQDSWRDTIQYSGVYLIVLFEVRRDSISTEVTIGVAFSTVENVQYCGGIPLSC